MAITTCPVRVSYPNLFTARSVNAGGKPTYSCTLMFDKNNKEQMACLKKLHQEATEVFNEKWPDKEKAPRIPLIGHDKSPIKDCDKNCDSQGVLLSEKNPESAGHYIIRASRYESSGAPHVVDRKNQKILDPNTIYGGCFCNVNVNAYAYNADMNKGVSFGLNGVQFWADEEPFGAVRQTVDEMFGAPSEKDEEPFGAVRQTVDEMFGAPSEKDVDPFADESGGLVDDDDILF